MAMAAMAVFDPCPVCLKGVTREHCQSPTCSWWTCPACLSYGDDTRMVDGAKLIKSNKGKWKGV